jgi:hypothetical protein
VQEACRTHLLGVHRPQLQEEARLGLQQADRGIRPQVLPLDKLRRLQEPFRHMEEVPVLVPRVVALVAGVAVLVVVAGMVLVGAVAMLLLVGVSLNGVWVAEVRLPAHPVGEVALLMAAQIVGPSAVLRVLGSGLGSRGRVGWPVRLRTRADRWLCTVPQPPPAWLKHMLTG